jgi:hypothetical protein
VAQDAIFRKASLFIVTGPNPHLHVVMNDPIYYPPKDGESVLVVCFCSYTGELQDGTCLLNAGDHGFIKWQTYVDYGRSEVKLSKPLESHVASGIHETGDEVSEDLYERIRQGFRQSRRTPRKVLNFMDFVGI